VSGQGLLNQPQTVTAQILDPNNVTTRTSSGRSRSTTWPNQVQLAAAPNFVFGPGCRAGLSQVANVVIAAAVNRLHSRFRPLVRRVSSRDNVIDMRRYDGRLAAGQSDLHEFAHRRATFTAAHQGTATFQSSNINISKSFTPNQIQAAVRPSPALRWMCKASPVSRKRRLTA